MPNSFDANGLQVATQKEIVTGITTDLQGIYGADINVDSNSPDGQAINVFAQAINDLNELLTGVYNSFNPDNAAGTVLDQRCALNGIQRKAGAYTYVTISITTDRSVTLDGIDQNAVEDAYKVSDSEGNEFVLVTTTNLTAGTTACNFRAVNIGAVEVLPNTITTPVTVILGVTGINNAGGATEEGENEETDAELRERRKKSVAISNTGYTDGLKAALLNLSDVSQVEIYNNRSDQTNADGMPPHSIWVVIEGGTNDEIGQVMDNKIAGGVTMKGSQNVFVKQDNGSYEEYKFDRPTAQLLYVNVVVTPYNGQQIDADYIKGQLIGNMTFSIYQTVTSSSIVCTLQGVQENAAFTATVSTDNVTFEDLAAPSTKASQFYLTENSITVTVTGEES